MESDMADIVFFPKSNGRITIPYSIGIEGVHTILTDVCFCKLNIRGEPHQTLGRFWFSEKLWGI
jgi:hypothetical protein